MRRQLQDKWPRNDFCSTRESKSNDYARLMHYIFLNMNPVSANRIRWDKVIFGVIKCKGVK